MKILRLLDRYVLHVFLAALWVFLVTFLALLLVIDFSTKVARFVALTSVSFLPFVVEYYLCRIPLFLMYILPPLTLFAAMFTMIKLQKTNEVLPIVASGTSLRRVTLPFIIASLIASIGIAAVDEFAMPHLHRRIADTDEILLTEEVTFSRISYDGHGNHFWAERYDHVTKEMGNILYSKFSTDGGHLRHELVITANRCRWDPTFDRPGWGRWICTEGTVTPFDDNGEFLTNQAPGERPRRHVIRIPKDGYAIVTQVLLDDLKRRSPLSGQSYTLGELNRRIEERPDDTRLRMMRHAKFSTPLSSVIILVLGLPFVVSARARSFFRGLTFCLIVTAAYYALQLAALEFGKLGRIDQVAAGWVAPTTFGIAGLILFFRMKS